MVGRTSPLRGETSYLKPVDEHSQSLRSSQSQSLASQSDSWHTSTPTKSRSSDQMPQLSRDLDSTLSRKTGVRDAAGKRASSSLNIHTADPPFLTSGLKKSEEKADSLSNSNETTSAAIDFSSQASSGSIFGALLSPTASTNPFLGMMSPKAAADLSLAAAPSDYMDARSAPKSIPRTLPNPAASTSSTTIITSFGRRRPSQKRTMSSSSKSTSTNKSEQADAVSELGSGFSGTVSTTGDRRCSDTTQTSTSSSAGTGITVPFASGEEQSQQCLAPWLDGVAEEKEEISSIQDLDDDLVTWDHFKEGVALEPPEAETQGLNAVEWATENKVKAAAAVSSYTSMTSSRYKPLRSRSEETESDNSLFKRPLGSNMVPLGEDGRTFRFIEMAKRMPSLSASETTTNLSRSSDCNPKTPTDANSSTSQSAPKNKDIATLASDLNRLTIEASV